MIVIRDEALFLLIFKQKQCLIFICSVIIGAVQYPIREDSKVVHQIL